jgi:hypothetical protein
VECLHGWNYLMLQMTSIFTVTPAALQVLGLALDLQGALRSPRWPCSLHPQPNELPRLLREAEIRKNDARRCTSSCRKQVLSEL